MRLAAPGSAIGNRDRGLHAKFVAGAGLALGDAFDLGRVQRVDLVLVLRLLGAHLFGELERLGEGLGDIGAALAQRLDLATNIAREPPEPGAHLAQVKLKSWQRPLDGPFNLCLKLLGKMEVRTCPTTSLLQKST